MAPLTPLVLVQVDVNDITDRRRLVEGLGATARWAIRAGSVGAVKARLGEFDDDLSAHLCSAGIPVAEPTEASGSAPVLTLPARSYPAPSMLHHLVLESHRLSAPTDAREIPLPSSAAPCRLMTEGDVTAVSVPAAVAFRDRRLGVDADIIDGPAEVGLSRGGFGRDPFLTVVMRTQGRRPCNLEEALTCLAAQTVDDFEIQLAVHEPGEERLGAVRDLVQGFADSFRRRIHIFEVNGGGRARPLNSALERAAGRYVAFLDDDDLVTADWVETFAGGASESPGSVIRAVSVNQRVRREEDGIYYATVGPPERVFARRFDLFEHLYNNSTPIFSFAVPRALVGDARFCEDLPFLEDWDFFLRMALAGDVYDTDRVTGIYHWWISGESTLNQVTENRWAEVRRRVIERFDENPLRLPPGSVTRLVALFDELSETRRACEAARLAAECARREADELKASSSWRIFAPLRSLAGWLRDLSPSRRTDPPRPAG